jgi:hypothetical protein
MTSTAEPDPVASRRRLIAARALTVLAIVLVVVSVLANFVKREARPDAADGCRPDGRARTPGADRRQSSRRAMAAMLEMKKIDIETLERAAEQVPA